MVLELRAIEVPANEIGRQTAPASRRRLIGWNLRFLLSPKLCSQLENSKGKVYSYLHPEHNGTISFSKKKNAPKDTMQ